ncbi:AAA family ATPase [Nannocystis bainbridge]|uniref:AAA family ATPase n=1 Tax=Nannocystis bainbridge TaxID=2995303 RepID=A0ABT5DWS2_9BACT|nr:AAA family ATPase [Nannocystis bainbridge]MDC0718005.1 AAA family ATPase [Nannocystis bainbridge]
MSTPTLRWLQIHQYEQFEPARIDFSRSENLILGLNGAGKTQLLKLIRAVLHLDFGEFLRQPFDVEFELSTHGVGEDAAAIVVRGHVFNAIHLPRFQNSEDLLKKLDKAAEESDTLGATVHFESDGGGFSLVLAGDTIRYQADDGSFVEEYAYRDRGELKPRKLVTAQGPSLKQMTGSLLPVCEACFVGESDREFEVLTNSLEFSFGRYFDPKHLATFTGFGDGTGRMWWHDVVRLLVRAWSSRENRWLNGVDLAIPVELLDKWQAPLRIRKITLHPQVVREAVRDGEPEFECRGLGLRVDLGAGTRVAHSGLTFGQRRYLYAGLVSLPRPGIPIVCDEIDNGMHPRLVRNLLELWDARQLFLASHNHLVIDSTNFWSPQDISEKIHIIRRRGDGRQVVNTFDEAMARELYKNIEVGLQSPSDVLEAEGLW